MTNNGKTIDTVELLSDWKTYFRSKIRFFCSKTNAELVIFRKPFILAPEHARSILMVDLNTSVSYRLIYFDQLVKFRVKLETFRERLKGRWSGREGSQLENIVIATAWIAS